MYKVLPEDFPVTEQERNLRRDRKRTTKMVVDNAGVKTLRTQRRETLALERQKPPKR